MTQSAHFRRILLAGTAIIIGIAFGRWYQTTGWPGWPIILLATCTSAAIITMAFRYNGIAGRVHACLERRDPGQETPRRLAMQAVVAVVLIGFASVGLTFAGNPTAAMLVLFTGSVAVTVWLTTRLMARGE